MKTCPNCDKKIGRLEPVFEMTRSIPRGFQTFTFSTGQCCSIECAFEHMKEGVDKLVDEMDDVEGHDNL